MDNFKLVVIWTFSFDLRVIFSVSTLTLILKIIGQLDVKHIATLPIKTILTLYTRYHTNNNVCLYLLNCPYYIILASYYLTSNCCSFFIAAVIRNLNGLLREVSQYLDKSYNKI